MHQGALTRLLTWQEPDGRRTNIVQRRFVSMKDEHLASLETTFTAENWTGNSRSAPASTAGSSTPA